MSFAAAVVAAVQSASVAMGVAGEKLLTVAVWAVKPGPLLAKRSPVDPQPAAHVLGL